MLLYTKSQKLISGNDKFFEFDYESCNDRVVVECIWSSAGLGASVPVPRNKLEIYVARRGHPVQRFQRELKAGGLNLSTVLDCSRAQRNFNLALIWGKCLRPSSNIHASNHPFESFFCERKRWKRIATSSLSTKNYFEQIFQRQCMSVEKAEIKYTTHLWLERWPNIIFEMLFCR